MFAMQYFSRKNRYFRYCIQYEEATEMVSSTATV